MSKTTKDLKRIAAVERATRGLSRSMAAPALAAIFMVATTVLVATFVSDGPLAIYVVAAAAVAGYMAMNIGANDVANNMGPAVGSRALTMAGALAIAAACEAAGAILAGGQVVNTIAKGIVTPDADMSGEAFILLMLSGALAAAIWVNLATYLSAPVSTTHAVVGGVVGAGIASSGVGVVDWGTMGGIAASWVVSPLAGGLIAALLLALAKWAIIFRADRVAAARRWVPVLIALMACVFAMYLATKGLSHLWSPSLATTAGIGVAAFAVFWLISLPYIAARSRSIDNGRKQVASLFTVPLILSTALLSFAHGANDVANAVGPLAAIVSTVDLSTVALSEVALPLWVLVVGAIGISIGLALFGPKLIRVVGEKITKIDPIRAYCVALSAGTTVLIASALGLPISTTHVAIGAVFGVGLLRELITNRGIPNPAVHPRTRFLKVSALNATPEQAIARSTRREKRRLVRRRQATGIAAAWVITVPASAALAALLYAVLNAVVG